MDKIKDKDDFKDKNIKIGTPANAFLSSALILKVLEKHNLKPSVKLFADGSGCFCFNPNLARNSQLQSDDWIEIFNLLGIDAAKDNAFEIVKGEVCIFFTYEMRNWHLIGKDIDSFRLPALEKEMKKDN
jgi:hypothetical protein